jgi:F0F1-type ATP synthase membrane subunit b/b'
MNITELLNGIEDILETAKAVPFSKNAMVDVDKIREHLEQIRLHIPVEIKEAQRLVSDRKQLLEQADRKAEEIIQQAQKRAAEILNTQDIKVQAERRAKEIISDAQKRSNAIITNGYEYTDGKLDSLEKAMINFASEIKQVRAELRAGHRGAVK